MAALSRLRKPVDTNRSILPFDMLELGAVETASSLRIGHGAGAADAYSATRADCSARSYSSPSGEGNHPAGMV
ncbi:MAG: hypothetical protein K2W91_01340, partial [Novosphingobium sp.]|nr:hypothetical protein [Novosphingobium sp.]